MEKMSPYLYISTFNICTCDHKYDFEKGKKKTKPSQAAKESKQNVNTEHNTMIRTPKRTAGEIEKK